MTRATTTLLCAALALAGCAAEPYRGPEPPIDPGPPDWPRGLRVVGNQLQDAAGNTIVLHGVNRSGTEYMCIQGGGIFDGAAEDVSIEAMRSWPNLNAVRIPLNEACWLGINEAPDERSGEFYKSAIKNYVLRLHKYDLIPILELHWVGPGQARADRLQPMPDADHALDFWTDIATTFLDDDGVILEPFNEPFPDGNKDTAAAWACWRDGCAANQYPTTNPPTTYQAAGMQALVDAIRNTGSSHVILLGGVQYSNALTQWLAHKPIDPLGQLGAAWHVYNFNGCKTGACWDAAPAAVAAAVPVVASEIGEDDCLGGFIVPLMSWLDGHGAGYLAWSWNQGAGCIPATMPGRNNARAWQLVTTYGGGAPNGGYAQAFHDHLANMPQ